MAEAQLDQGLDYLHSFVGALAEKQADLGTVGERLGHLQSNLEALTGHLDATREHVVQTSDERQHQLEGAVAAAEAAGGGLLDEGHQTGRTLTEVVAAAFDERHDQIDGKTHEHGERLTAAHQHLHEHGFEVASQAVQSADTKLQDVRGQTDVAHQELAAKVDELSTTVQAGGEATTGAFTGATQQMDGDLLQLMDTGLGSFNQVTDQLMGDDGVAGAFAGFGGGVEGGFGQLGDYVTGMGDQLVEQVDGLIADTVQVVEQEVVQRIQDEFEKVVVGSVEGLLTDFVDSIGMMSVGSALTAAIGPFVPELATAKTVVSAVDDLMDSLNLFG